MRRGEEPPPWAAEDTYKWGMGRGEGREYLKQGKGGKYLQTEGGEKNIWKQGGVNRMFSSILLSPPCSRNVCGLACILGLTSSNNIKSPYIWNVLSPRMHASPQTL